MLLREAMQYDCAIGFPRARDALAAWCEITGDKIAIPSNCCPALLPFAKEILPIDPETGLAPCPVQLYGYRQIFPGAKIEIDPLMTGLLGEPFAESCIVSFGYSKTIDIGGGGAILTNDKSLAAELEKRESFPPILINPLADALSNIHATIMEKKKQYEQIENEMRRINNISRLPRPVLPWRFTALCQLGERDTVIYNCSTEFKLGKNYPPLPGVTDPCAIEWGKRVINIWR